MDVQFRKFVSYLLSILIALPIWLLGPSLALAVAPVVESDDISVSGATGLGGAYIIGDTVTAVYVYDDSANDPSFASSVTIDFTEFGGGAVAASDIGSNQWQAQFVIAPGTIDINTADVSVTVTNADGTTGPVSDNEDHIIDNIAPLTAGEGMLTIVKNNPAGPGVAGIGDQVSFAAGTLDVSDSAVWSVNLASPNNLTGEATLAAGSTSSLVYDPTTEGIAEISGSMAFNVLGVDDAGNETLIVGGTNSLDIDTVRPQLVAASTETTSTILVDFSEQIDEASVSPSDFSVTSPARVVTLASRISNTRVRLQVASAFSSGATPTVTIVDDGSTGLYDTAGNKVSLGSQVSATDGIKPQVGPDVASLSYTEGKNDREDTLSVGFTENITVPGTLVDYSVIYDADGDFMNATDQRPVNVKGVSNPEMDATVDLSIDDQSGQTDSGGKFQVLVSTSGNVQDASGNGVDPSANTVVSGSVNTFDSYSPTLMNVGLDPNSDLLGVGDSVTVFANTDDGANDQHLLTVTGTIYTAPLSFHYNVGTSRYEAIYTVSEGDADQVNLEALGISFRDRALHDSNVLSTSGNSLSVDGHTPFTPTITDPATSEVINSNNRVISGTAEAGTLVQVYSDPNNDGDKSDGSVVGSAGATGGVFSVVVPLSQNANNDFVVTAGDLAGNESTASDVPNIYEDSVNPTKPVATPPAGDYTAMQLVSLGSTDDHGSVDIYYTTDGSTPNSTKNSYIAPIVVDRDMVLKAISYDGARNTSEVLEAIYTVIPNISNEASPTIGETSATITWDTNQPSTSRVIYDTVSHPSLAAAPDYGYAHSTLENSTKVTSHSVTISGLLSGTTYYYRTVSHGSPEQVGAEKSFSTLSTSYSGVAEDVSSVTVETPTTTTTPITLSPEVLGEQTEDGAVEGEAWWILLVPVALVLLVGAILPLGASTAISVPIIGAVIALVLTAYTKGDMRSTYAYLALGGETILLLLINYGLLSRGTIEEAEPVVTIEEPKPKPKKRKKRR